MNITTTTGTKPRNMQPIPAVAHGRPIPPLVEHLEAAKLLAAALHKLMSLQRSSPADRAERYSAAVEQLKMAHRAAWELAADVHLAVDPSVTEFVPICLDSGVAQLVRWLGYESRDTFYEEIVSSVEAFAENAGERDSQATLANDRKREQQRP